jgi:hypothetical protein
VLGPIFGNSSRTFVRSANGRLVVVPGSSAAGTKAASLATTDPATPTIKSAAAATRAATLSVASAAATDLSGVARNDSHGSTLPSVARVALIMIVALALLAVLLGPRLPFLQGPEDEFELAGKNPLMQRLLRRQRGVAITPGGNPNFRRAPHPQ